jgi:hypothetical protein
MWILQVESGHGQGPPESGHVESEGLQRGFVLKVFHVQELDGHVPVPVAHVDRAEPPAADLFQQAPAI